ncbi:MAG: hypothetical protein LC730_03560 [Acidobacteria bacterium]|nr:hypothetical protein [Acidobacteriota bacterium]MCA1608522.1 hypothetical protein [Acidobacteriota bacterium]
MPGSSAAEIYFVAAMMVLILVFCGVSVYFFFRQYKKEMREKREHEASVQSQKKATAVETSLSK